MADSIFDAEAFNTFEHRGWETNNLDAYQEVFGPMTSLGVDALLDAAKVRRGTRLLDVATGPGYVAGRAAERGAKVGQARFSREACSLKAALVACGCNQGLGRAREIREAASAILSCVAWENQISTQRSNSTSRCSSMSRNVGSRSASLT